MTDRVIQIIDRYWAALCDTNSEQCAAVRKRVAHDAEICSVLHLLDELSLLRIEIEQQQSSAHSSTRKWRNDDYNIGSSDDVSEAVEDGRTNPK